jgi:hypothetical protein
VPISRKFTINRLSSTINVLPTKRTPITRGASEMPKIEPVSAVVVLLFRNT